MDNQASTSPGASTLELVVIGGSAGSLGALERLLPALPDDFVVPIVVVVHVPQHRPSGLATALARHTVRPVVEADDKMPLAPGHVFVAPADYHLLIEAGARPALAVSADAPLNYSIPSIDVLFESAAVACGPRVAAIVLSGANEDGARGLEAVVVAGGTGFVQSPTDAECPAMPLAALARVPAAVPEVASGLAHAVAALARTPA